MSTTAHATAIARQPTRAQRTLRAWIKRGPVGQQVANELHLVSELWLSGISGGDGDAQLRADEGSDGTVGNGGTGHAGLRRLLIGALKDEDRPATCL